MELLNTILQIPERSLVNKKITKAFFKRNFSLTNSEKSLLDDFNIVISIDWLACVSPSSANIIPYQDDQYLFEEIQVISVQTAETEFGRNCQSIADLVQKYIPYPVLLCIWHSQTFMLNTCDKKINQNDNTRRTLEKKYSSGIIKQIDYTEQQQAFLNSLAFAKLDKTDLKTYYDSYSRCIITLQTAEVSGQYIPRTGSRTKSDLENLEKIDTLQKDIQLLQSQGAKESQLNRRIALNIEIQQKRKELEQLIVLIKE